jgi:hypothetical protein
MVAHVGYSMAGRSRGQVAPCAVCTWHVETRSVGFLVEPQNQGGGGFPSLGLKTGRSDLMIWDSKSPRWFLGLCLKTKWASICRLRHKTDGGSSVWDTRRDLAACLVSKQVWSEDWRRRDYGWCTWHHRGGCVGGKLKLDGLRQTLLPLLYRFPSIRPQGRSSHFSLLLGPIYGALCHFLIAFSRS